MEPTILETPRIYNGSGIYNNGAGGGGGGGGEPLPGEFRRIYETKFSNFSNGTDTPIIGDPVSGYDIGGLSRELINDEYFIICKNNNNINFGPTIDITGAKKISFGERIYTKINSYDGANLFILSQNKQIIIIDPAFVSPPRDYCVWGAITPRSVFLNGQADSNYTNYYEIPNKAYLYDGGTFDIKIEIDLTKSNESYFVYINNSLFIVGSGDFSAFTYLKFAASSSRTNNVLGYTNCFVDVLE